MSFKNFKLGKLPAKFDPKTLQFSNYVEPSLLPSVPKNYNWGKKVKSWTMMKNDEVGNCTIATAGHMIQTWTSNIGKIHVVSDKEVITAYSGVSGYNPKTGDNDNGAVMLDVLKYWKKTGIGEHKITGYVQVQPKNRGHIQAAIYLFGTIDVGISLPASIEQQTGPGLKWDVPKEGLNGDGEPGSLGGHAVNIVSYDSTGVLLVTWGFLQFATWRFVEAYCDEIYAVLSGDWINAKEKSPSGFNLSQLQLNLKDL
jgi:hypothetical protein